MKEFQEFIGWLIGVLAVFFGGFFGMFKWLKAEFETRDAKIDAVNSRLSKVSEKVAEVESDLKKELADIKLELALNKQQDASNHRELVTAMKNLSIMVGDLKEQQNLWAKNIENFYYQNPQLKKPDA